MAENSIRIAADTDTVWEVLCDGWKYTNWVVGASHMRAVEAEWPQRGAKLFHSVGAWPLMTRDVTEVDAVEPKRRLVLIAHGRPVLGTAVVELELQADGDGCEVTMRERPIAGPGKWFYNPAAEAVLHRRNTESLQRFAALCERRTEPSE
jgi:uncharacterized protein YndB with AHSA1/START domain